PRPRGIRPLSVAGPRLVQPRLLPGARVLGPHHTVPVAQEVGILRVGVPPCFTCRHPPSLPRTLTRNNHRRGTPPSALPPVDRMPRSAATDEPAADGVDPLGDLLTARCGQLGTTAGTAQFGVDDGVRLP